MKLSVMVADLNLFLALDTNVPVAHFLICVKLVNHRLIMNTT